MLMLPAVSQDSPAWDEAVSSKEVVLPRRCCASSRHFAGQELMALPCIGLYVCPKESKQLLQFDVLHRGPCLNIQLIIKNPVGLMCSIAHWRKATAAWVNESGAQPQAAGRQS